MSHWWNQPVAGDIVWCLFPQDDELEPGPKPRPGLLMKVSRVLGAEEQYAVQVVYGTSQKVDSLYSGEFMIARDDKEAFKLSGLSYPTKFNLKNMVELPYDDRWFAIPPDPRHGRNPKLGTLHPSLMPRLRAARNAFRPSS